MLKDRGVYLFLYPQGLEQSRHSNKCKMNEVNGGFLLDVLIASGLLRHNLYSSTNFNEELHIPFICRIICFLVTWELESL